MEQFWWVALAGAALFSLAAIDTLARPDGWSTTWSTAVVAAGVAAWQCAAMWWVVLAVDAPSAASGRAWGATALCILVGGQALCIAATWAPLDWLARRRRLVGRGAALVGAGCWLLAFGAASTLRQLSWAGDGLASLSTAAVDAPGAKAWLPIVGAQGFDGLLLSAIAVLALSLLLHDAKLLGLAALALFAMSIPSWLPATPWTHADGPEVRVVALQAKAVKGVAWTTRERDETLDLVAAAIDAAPRGAVVVTPETYVAEPPPAAPEGRWTELLEHVDAHGVHLLLGMPQRDPGGDGREPGLMNAVVQLSPQRQSVYAKERLVPGGEYLPWPALMEAVYTRAFSGRVRSQNVAPPELTQPLYVAGTELGMSICYEQGFAYTMAERAEGAGWLANVSDDSWIGAAGYRQQMLSTARLRAMEFAKPLLRVTSGGRSALIDPAGRVVAAARGLGQELLQLGVAPRTGLTPYAQAWRFIAAAPLALWALAALWLAAAGRSAPGWQLAKEPTT